MPWLYDDPETLNYKTIDPAIRELVATINQSEWLRTEESCSGHPANETSAWGGMSLYIRLVVIKPEMIWNFLWMADLIRASYVSMMGWHLAVLYDRQDELGSHWYLTLDYNKDISMRLIAADIMLRAFVKAQEVDI